ncbi:MAG: glycosyl transferase [Bacteroidetes bacterium]|nr:MAG: glycosyl transferase [Bacteroidota bacterium]
MRIVPPLDFFILIPYYNDLPGLCRSLGSVRYNLSRYGVLIVDDGSAIPLRLEMVDVTLPRLSFIIRLAENQGITAALNAGLRWLKQRGDYRFVARLDCGDLCRADRFIRQVNYLETYADIDLLGSWARFENFSTGFSYHYRTPQNLNRIVRGMHFRNLFIHPTVMWRATVQEKVPAYPDDLPHAEDYGFFCELLRHGRAAIIPDELVTCKIDPQGLSLRYRRQQLRSRIKTVLRYRRSRILGLLGALKLSLLLFLPYRILLLLKSI